MVVVIQCAASKKDNAGYLQTPNGMPVMFVAHPEYAPDNGAYIYKQPDNIADNGNSWRNLLVEYNTHPHENPCKLLRAYKLYKHPAYNNLVEHFGVDYVYILSAGWGLISSNFLTPNYDITFTQNAEPYKRRRKWEKYQDLHMLPADVNSPIVFLGGKDYVPLFCSLTEGAQSERIVFFNSNNPPEAPGCNTQRYFTTTKTNWHYECAEAIIQGRIRV